MVEKLLIIDDEENMRHMLSVMTSRAGYDVSLAEDGLQGLQAITKGNYNFVLCDLKMPTDGRPGIFAKAAKEKTSRLWLS